MCFQDFVLGVLLVDNVIVFFVGIIIGVMFDKKLIYVCGVVIGEEYCGKGINVYLGFFVGFFGWKFLGGCNWEGFGFDLVF